MSTNKENFVEYNGIKFELGTLEDIPDEELADPDELERAYYRELWGPVFQISKPKSSSYNPVWDCHTDVDFNAFASVDFDRHRPAFDVTRYKADKLKSQLKDLVILIEMLNERVKDKAKYRILKYVRAGVINVDDINNWDMWLLAKLYMKTLGLRKQIIELCETSKHRREQRVQKWLASLG
jgi:hypothetical protein